MEMETCRWFDIGKTPSTSLIKIGNTCILITLRQTHIRTSIPGMNLK